MPNWVIDAGAVGNQSAPRLITTKAIEVIIGRASFSRLAHETGPTERRRFLRDQPCMK